MKSHRIISFTIVLIFVFNSCNKDNMEMPDEGSGTNPSQTVNADEKDPVFIVDENYVEETDEGFSYKGTLFTVNDQNDTFSIAEGEFEFKLDINGNLISFIGEGLPVWPDVGIYEILNKSFEFVKGLSFIQYETGEYYKRKYGTPIPLSDDRKYLHYTILDESKDDTTKFEYRSLANTVSYLMVDFYLDPLDPAIFFKTNVPNTKSLSSALKGTKNAYNKLVKEAVKNFGESLFQHVISKSFIIGLSNNGLFESREYRWSNPRSFLEVLGNHGFEKHNSHLFVRIQGFNIPYTYILRAHGELFTHSPQVLNANFDPSIQDRDKEIKAVVDFLSDPFVENTETSFLQTFNGSGDWGGKGIAKIFMVLAGIQSIIDQEPPILVENIDLDIIGGTIQRQIDPDSTKEFFKMAFEFEIPTYNDVFTDESWPLFVAILNCMGAGSTIGIEKDIDGNVLLVPYSGYGKNYFKNYVSPYDNNFFVYTEIPNNKADFFVFVNGSFSFNNLWQTIDCSKDTYLLITKDNVQTGGWFTFNYDGNHVFYENDIYAKGVIDSTGYKLRAQIDRDFDLSFKDLNTSATSHSELILSSETGVTYDTKLNCGNAILLDGTVNVAKKGLSFSGEMVSGASAIPGKVTVNIDPENGASVEGYFDIPQLGELYMSGKLTDNGVELHGKYENVFSNSNIENVLLSLDVTLSTMNGVTLNGTVDMGDGLGMANVEGSVTDDQLLLSGTFKMPSIKVGSNTFRLENSRVTINSDEGVGISGLLDLYGFGKITVNGYYSGGNSYFLHWGCSACPKVFTEGNKTLTINNLRIDVDENKVRFYNGKGCLEQGVITLCPIGVDKIDLEFTPNWNQKTITVCPFDNLLQQICVTI